MSQKMITLYTVDFSFLLKYQTIVVLTNDKVVFISGLNHKPWTKSMCVWGGGGGWGGGRWRAGGLNISPTGGKAASIKCVKWTELVTSVV